MNDYDVFGLPGVQSSSSPFAVADAITKAFYDNGGKWPPSPPAPASSPPSDHHGDISEPMPSTPAGNEGAPQGETSSSSRAKQSDNASVNKELVGRQLFKPGFLTKKAKGLSTKIKCKSKKVASYFGFKNKEVTSDQLEGLQGTDE